VSERDDLPDGEALSENAIRQDVKRRLPFQPIHLDQARKKLIGYVNSPGLMLVELLIDKVALKGDFNQLVNSAFKPFVKRRSRASTSASFFVNFFEMLA